jgi:hypothetical protein
VPMLEEQVSSWDYRRLSRVLGTLNILIPSPWASSASSRVRHMMLEFCVYGSKLTGGVLKGRGTHLFG